MTREGLAFTIPSTFLSCVGRLNAIQLGADFASEYVSWHLRLQALQVRLQRWGRAAGITDQQPADFSRRFQETHDPKIVKQTWGAVNGIEVQLKRAQEDSGIISWSSEDPLVLIDGLKQISLCDAGAKKADVALEKLRTHYQKRAKTTSEVTYCGKWALYQTKQLNTLLEAIGEHISTLETLFPAQLAELVEKETKEFESEAVQALSPIIQDGDAILTSALEKVLPKGSRWQHITTKGKTRVHLGHNYSRETDQGVSSWSNLKIRGNGFFHAGHNYGYQTKPVP